MDLLEKLISLVIGTKKKKMGWLGSQWLGGLSKQNAVTRSCIFSANPEILTEETHPGSSNCGSLIIVAKLVVEPDVPLIEYPPSQWEISWITNRVSE